MTEHELKTVFYLDECTEGLKLGTIEMEYCTC
jgi:hypothetical protein